MRRHNQDDDDDDDDESHNLKGDGDDENDNEWSQQFPKKIDLKVFLDTFHVEKDRKQTKILITHSNSGWSDHWTACGPDDSDEKVVALHPNLLAHNSQSCLSSVTPEQQIFKLQHFYFLTSKDQIDHWDDTQRAPIILACVTLWCHFEWQHQHQAIPWTWVLLPVHQHQ